MKKISLLFLLLTLVFSLILTSCGDVECQHNDDDGDLVCNGCGIILPDPNLDGKIIYEITVVDENGAPCPNIIVELYNGEEKIATKITSADGVVKCSEEHPVEAAEAPFTVKLISPDGKALNYDEESAKISDGAEKIRIELFKTTLDLPTEPLYLDSDLPAMAPIMSEGRYRVDLKAGANYFVFYATARGQYKISSGFVKSGEAVPVGYYGAPHFVQSQNIAATDGTGDVFIEDSALIFNIRAFNAGEDYYSSSRYVVRVDASADSEAFIEIKCIDKNLPLSKEELPWEDVLLPKDPVEYTPGFSVDSADELPAVSVIDPDFKAVYNSNDGFYHVGTADGPIIFVKLSVDSPYLASFKTIMETTQLRCYIYDEEGNLVSKRNYHDMMEKYITAAGDLGIYPLTSYLKDALSTIGDAWGWYASGANNIFTGKFTVSVVPGNAYLFACCYYEEN